jgi:hypothetical protein
MADGYLMELAAQRLLIAHQLFAPKGASSIAGLYAKSFRRRPEPW